MNTELKNEISALITMTKTLLKISMRYPLDFTAGFISLLFWILMFFTAALVFASPENSATSSFYINSITWGMIIFFFINDLVWTMGVGIRYAQITGILEQTFLTPNKEHIYPLSRALRSLLLTISFSIWALLLMELLTGAVRIVNPLLGIYILIISAIMFMGFGFLYAGLIINIKKAQFMSPYDVKYVIEKINSAGNKKILLTERGTCFGYNNLVVDFRSLLIMKKFGYPVIFDATHSLQKPSQNKGVSGGDRMFVLPFSQAAVACGCDGLFLEVHPQPQKALSDKATSFPLYQVEKLLKRVLKIRKILDEE